MNPAGLSIPAGVAAAVVAHARAELPNEACGLLAGHLATGRATSYYPARNAYASPLRYDVHPEDLVRIVFEIEAAGEELVAVFHSHTGTPAVPSATDIRDGHYPILTVIASLVAPDHGAAAALRVWRIADGSAAEVAVEISG